MSGRTHDHYCSACDLHWSPFDFDLCPGCGSMGVYDLNHELGQDPAPSLDADQR